MLHLQGNKIACVPIFDPDKIGHIYVPDMAKERADQGIVKYIGPKVEWIKPGDYILFSGYTGTLVKLEDEGLLILLPEDFVTARIDDVPVTDVPGLFFKGKDGYFTATYEMAMELIAKGIGEADWHKKFNVKKSIPSVSDYDRMK